MAESKQSESTVSRGAGLSGTAAVKTAVLTKATAVTPIAVLPSITRGGLGTVPPATAAGFDRTVATSLGK